MDPPPHLLHLVKEIAKVQNELHELSHASYSQSNPSRTLGLRSLERKRDQLVDQWKKEHVAWKSHSTSTSSS